MWKNTWNSTMEKISKCEGSEFRRITLCTLNWYASKTCAASFSEKLRKPQKCKVNLLHPHISHSSLTPFKASHVTYKPLQQLLCVCNSQVCSSEALYSQTCISQKKFATLRHARQQNKEMIWVEKWQELRSACAQRSASPFYAPNDNERRRKGAGR